MESDPRFGIIHWLRFIFMLVIHYLHTMWLLSAHMPAGKHPVVSGVRDHILFQIIGCGRVHSDVGYVINGFQTAYFMLEISEKTSYSGLQLIIKRIAQTIPLLVAVLLLGSAFGDTWWSLSIVEKIQAIFYYNYLDKSKFISPYMLGINSFACVDLHAAIVMIIAVSVVRRTGESAIALAYKLRYLFFVLFAIGVGIRFYTFDLKLQNEAIVGGNILIGATYNQKHFDYLVSNYNRKLLVPW